MSYSFTAALERFSLPEFNASWAAIQRGIEKESLRVTDNGKLSQRPHPTAMGSALAHPYITTDYSEALLELITPVATSIDECLGFLSDLHKFVYATLPEDERLWVNSMPCLVEREEQIPLALYGSSNIGQMKTLYREGLGHRYSRLMQTIAGIHYNFSMPDVFWEEYHASLGSTESLQDFRTSKYLHLIRNFRRYSWLLVYLFGASPAVSRTFTQNRPHDLQDYDQATLYKPYATCLRMGDLGYRSDAQGSIYVCYNELDNYIDSLYTALSTPYPPYEEIGMERDGRLLQINTNLLQLENEFYSTIRPKRVGDGKRPLELLQESGIQYIEVRALDLNPFLPMGIDAEQIRFLDTFLLYCLLAESPQCDETEYTEIEANLSVTVNRGREPGLKLSRKGQQIELATWATELLDDLGHAARLLDDTQQTDQHAAALNSQLAKVKDSSLTPSAQVLQVMAEQQLPFCAFGMQASTDTQTLFQQQPLPGVRFEELKTTSADSLVTQTQIEAGETVDFSEFLRDWNDYKLG